MAVNSLTNRALRSRRWNVSVIVVDIVVDRGSIFARGEHHRRFYAEDCRPWRTADMLHFRFTLCSLPFDVTPPHRTLLLLLLQEEEQEGMEEGKRRE